MIFVLEVMDEDATELKTKGFDTFITTETGTPV